MTESSRRLSLLETAAASSALAGALALNYAAGRYVDRVGARAPAIPDDLFLHLVPAIDLSALFIWGFAAFVALAAGAALFRERGRAAYIAWMYAVLVSIRGAFLVMTPMGSPSGAASVEGYVLFDAVGRYLTFGHDLFFSAHTSMPFLGYLIFRDRTTRTLMLLLSLSLAFSVLACRLHYSIDVAAAFFITYATVLWHEKKVEPLYRRLRERLAARLEPKRAEASA